MCEIKYFKFVYFLNYIKEITFEYAQSKKSRQRYPIINKSEASDIIPKIISDNDLLFILTDTITKLLNLCKSSLFIPFNYYILPYLVNLSYHNLK